MNAFRDVLQDKILLRGTIFSLCLCAISIIIIAFYYNSLPPFIPLFNQMPWGEQRIIRTLWIALIPSIALVFLGTNLFFANRLYKTIPLIARLFSITSFLISVLAFLFVIRTINAAL